MHTNLDKWGRKEFDRCVLRKQTLWYPKWYPDQYFVCQSDENRFFKIGKWPKFNVTQNYKKLLNDARKWCKILLKRLNFQFLNILGQLNKNYHLRTHFQNIEFFIFYVFYMYNKIVLG